MSVRRSSRIKKLDLDESTRERILFEQPTVRVDQRRSMGDRGPYARKNVDRLLKHQAVHGQQQDQQTEGVEASPIRNVFGLLSGKIQDLMKGIFPKFSLFTENSGTDAEVAQEVPQPQVTQVPHALQEPKAPSLRASRSLHASLEAIKPTDDVDVRRTAYAELASFFAEHRKTPMNPLDVPKIVGLVNRTAAAPIRLGRATSTSAVMATPLPRKVIAMGTPSVSKMPSLPRIQVPPSTQLKFRTIHRVEPVVKDLTVSTNAHAPPLDLEQEVKHEFERSLSESVNGSPMKVSVQVEPPVKMEKKDGPIPNRFVGLFYLDPDEEEEELLLQERKAAEQQKRIEVLAARKTQREKRISFRDKKVDEKPEVKMIFDFGPAEPKEEEAPLINLGTPAKEVKEKSEVQPSFHFELPAPAMAQKPAPTFSFDLPSAATKLPTASQEQKRKRSLMKEDEPGVKPAPFTFTLPEKPQLSFKPTDEPSIPQIVPPAPVEKAAAEGEKKEVLPVFSFKMPNETKPAFPFAAPSEGDKPDEKKRVSFSFESKPAEAPKFLFGAAASIPAPGFGSAAPGFGSAIADKTPTFGSATADKPGPVFGAPQGEKPAFSFVAPLAEKPSPVFSTATSEKPSPVFDSSEDAKPSFTFGAAPASGAEAHKTAFSTGGDSKPSFTFGASSDAAKTPITFGAAKPELNPVLFGPPSTGAAGEEKKAEEPKPLSFGFSSAFGSAPAPVGSEAKPTFGFGGDAPKFSFGGPSTDTGKPSPFGFPGAAKTEEAKPSGEQPKSAFSFQFSGPTPATSEPLKFSFGAPTQNKPFAFTQPAPATTTGDDAMMEDNIPVAPAPAATTSPFTFAGASPAFSANPPAVAPFSFANAAPSPPHSSTTPTFGFGSPALGAQSAFTFGQGNPAASSTPQPFTFGQASGATDPFTFGQPAMGMNALANAAMVDPNSVGFNMGATNTTGKKGPVSRPRRR